MQFTSKSSAPSHLTSTQRLLVLHLIRARERAGLSRAQMAERTDFLPQEIENIESGTYTVDPVELRVWCRAVGASFTEFVREFDAALSSQEAAEMNGQQEASSGVPNIYLLRFSPDALPELLTVKNTPQTIQSLLGTTKVRVFATHSSATLGFSAADSTREEMAGADDSHDQCTLLQPAETFLVVAGEFEGIEVPASAPRNEDLSWAPLAAWVLLCPHALDLASAEDRERLRLASLSPLQVELALARFAPQLSDGVVEHVLSAHPDGVAWMADWND